jgi:hypothetical protein
MEGLSWKQHNKRQTKGEERTGNNEYMNIKRA